MSNFRTEPFLWIHLTGIALAPLLLQLVWLGLAVGDPLPLFWLELLLVGAIGVIPILWMQWTRPFDFFSILLVCLKPNSLTDQQRQILSLLKTRNHKIVSGITAVILLIIGWQLYQWAPLASMTATLLPSWRLLGLMIAAIAFLLSNLFIQVPVSVLGVLFTSNQQWLTTEPYLPEKILADFTVFGFQVNKIFLIPSSQEQPNNSAPTS
jgi:hypothetical protein